MIMEIIMAAIKEREEAGINENYFKKVVLSGGFFCFRSAGRETPPTIYLPQFRYFCRKGKQHETVAFIRNIDQF